ncbi:lipase 1-like [Pieris napi]|uniref:lipase 1-like n=1 Tax=Pieris napi TaxID=78633 RepID=UPI001FB9B257|nr:lipase 1-like [Pieris napi]
MGVFKSEVIFLYYTFLNVVVPCDIRASGRQSFEELATKYGHPPQEYQVTTEDGYILTLHRFPGSRDIPVLLQHGTLDSSATWILRGNDSLGITLANANYDVWMSNLRGNTYSRKHTYLDPDTDAAFWDIDLDHFGIYDLSAIIDFILQVTGAKKLNAIGHSAGNTVFYVLGSIRPQYNSKINVLIALAPIAYFHSNHKPVAWLSKNAEIINNILLAFNIHELLGETKLQRKLAKLICSQPDIGYEICMNSLLFPLVGFDNEEISPEFNPIIFGHFPAGFPRKTLIHYSQIFQRKSFGPFDYGDDNVKYYNRTRPPSYNLSAVSMRIILIAGQNDKLAPLKNVNRLRKNLPNVVKYIVPSQKRFNHIDFTWGEHTKLILFPIIFDALENNNY